MTCFGEFLKGRKEDEIVLMGIWEQKKAQIKHPGEVRAAGSEDALSSEWAGPTRVVGGFLEGSNLES